MWDALLSSNKDWEVELLIVGPVTVPTTQHRHERKRNRANSSGFDTPIVLSRDPAGIKVELIARAQDADRARKVALVYFGRVLDVLVLQVNCPMRLVSGNIFEPSQRRQRDDVRRQITGDEWDKAFPVSLSMLEHEPTFLRALGWYRKAIITEDPLDAFFAYWISIEVVAGKYHPPIPEGREKGSKSQTWECFKLLWGDCLNWPIIPGETNWIDDYYEIRNAIAHGNQPVNVEFVDNALSRLPTLQKVAYQFLAEWSLEQLNPQVLIEMPFPSTWPIGKSLNFE